MARVSICGFSWGDMNRHLFIPDRAWMVDEKQFYSCPAWWTSGLLGVPYRSIGIPRVAASPKLISAWVMSHGSYMPRTHCKLCRQLHWRGPLLPRNCFLFLSHRMWGEACESYNFLNFLKIVSFFESPWPYEFFSSLQEGMFQFRVTSHNWPTKSSIKLVIWVKNMEQSKTLF